MWEPDLKRTGVSDFQIVKAILEPSDYRFDIHHYEPLSKVTTWGCSRIIDIIDPVNDEEDIMMSFYFVGGDILAIKNRFEDTDYTAAPDNLSWLVSLGSCQDLREKDSPSIGFELEYYNKHLGTEKDCNKKWNSRLLGVPCLADRFISVIKAADAFAYSDLEENNKSSCGQAIIWVGECITDLLGIFHIEDNNLVRIESCLTRRQPKTKNVPSYLCFPGAI